MKIAITGGSGGIGRAVVAMALEQGHTVVSIDQVAAPPEHAQAGVSSAVADITDFEALKAAMAGCEALIHLAAIPTAGQLPDQIVHNNNVVGSYNAMLAAVQHGMTRICQASSVNAIGHSYSRSPRYDYFPLDEDHPTYNEDPYSLSKWICEQQADSLVRRYEGLRIASLRFHWVVPTREDATRGYSGTPFMRDPKHLWAYTVRAAAARACLLGVTADFTGHQPLFIVAPDSTADRPTLELIQEHYPHAEVRGDLSGNAAFFSSARAERVLGWRHDA